MGQAFFLTRNMNHDGRTVDQSIFASFDEVAFVIDPHQITTTNGGEALAKSVQPHGLWIYRISARDVSSNSLVESSLSEDSECSSKVLLPVQSLFLEAFEFGVCSDLEFPAVLGPAQRTHFGVVVGLIKENGCNWSHGG